MSSKTDFLPSRDAELLQWSANFREQLALLYVSVGITEQQSNAYAAADALYAQKYDAATTRSTRTPVAIVGKNDAQKSLKKLARKLAAIIRAHPGTTDFHRRTLGLKPGDGNGTPVAVPLAAPEITIRSTAERRIRVRLRDTQSPENRGKPAGMFGATVLMYIGEQPTADLSMWSFVMNTTRTLFHVDVPARVPAGSRIWLCALWINTKAQPGPISSPASARVGDGVAKAAA